MKGLCCLKLKPSFTFQNSGEFFVCDKQLILEDCPSHLTLDLNGISTDFQMNTFLKTRKPCVSQPNRGRKGLQSALFSTQRSRQQTLRFVCFLDFWVSQLVLWWTSQSQLWQVTGCQICIMLWRTRGLLRCTVFLRIEYFLYVT